MLIWILACDIKWNIWNNWELLVRIPSDLKRFKEFTSWNTVIMWRKTFESIWRSLPNRENIIVTRDLFAFHEKYPEYITKTTSLSTLDLDVIKNLWKDKQLFVIWGAELYNRLLPICDKIELTQIYHDFWDCDSRVDIESILSQFQKREESEMFSEQNIDYQYITYYKK